jgi:hypothetical protein
MIANPVVETRGAFGARAARLVSGSAGHADERVEVADGVGRGASDVIGGIAAGELAARFVNVSARDAHAAPSVADEPLAVFPATKAVIAASFVEVSARLAGVAGVADEVPRDAGVVSRAARLAITAARFAGPKRAAVDGTVQPFVADPAAAGAAAPAAWLAVVAAGHANPIGPAEEPTVAAEGAAARETGRAARLAITAAGSA